jgi:hypothetical protein
MNVLFLDIDGVLNAWGESALFSDARCKLLEPVLEEFDVVMILSSMHRHTRPVSEIRDRMRASTGMDHRNIARLTEPTPLDIMACQPAIEAWLARNSHRVKRWVAVDDERMSLTHMVRTNPRLGLTAEDARRIALLFRYQGG